MLYIDIFCIANFFIHYVTKIFAVSSKFTNKLLIILLHYQSIVWPFIIIGVISNIICVILHAILVMAVHLGVM